MVILSITFIVVSSTACIYVINEIGGQHNGTLGAQIASLTLRVVIGKLVDYVQGPSLTLLQEEAVA